MKSNLFAEIINRFYLQNKIKFYCLFIFSLFAGLFEYMGLILIFQFVLFLTNPNTKHCVGLIDFFETNLKIFDLSKISLILGISIALIYILKNIYMLIFTKFNNEILQDLSIKITTKIIKNLLFQDYLKVNSISSEEKLNILSKVSFVVWQYCYKYINLVINCTIAIILLSYLFVKFTLAASVATIFISALALVEYNYLAKNSTHQNKHFSVCFDELNSLILKVISSIKEIKLNNKQEYFATKIEEKCEDYSILNKNRTFCDVFHIYFTEISVMLAMILVLGVLFCTTNFDNQILITTICTICVVVLRLTPVVNRAQSCLYAINSNKGLVAELLKFDDKFDKNFNFSTTQEKLSFNKTIELRNVDFSYQEDIGLKNIDLKINKGSFVGIVGKSGCCKTTLSLILSGLIKAQSGEFLIDGKKINNLDYQKWQNNIALLSQDYSILFDEIEDDKYIEKLNLKIDAKANKLSYGEKQRYALANILSQEKEILILDEVTSSSDVILENEINNILLSLKRQKTIIAIAHRFNILKYCDEIIYMHDGKIIDIGSFETLSKKYDEFKKMVELSSFKCN